MGLHLSSSFSSDTDPEVRYSAAPLHDPDFEVQMFLGSSFQTLYMSAETARAFAEKILAVVPAPELVQS